MFLSVGEISKILGVSTETVRHYVQEGVISPQKNEENNYWEYSSEDFLRLTDVLFYRSAGLSVKEIKTIMDGIPVEDIGKVINARRKELTNTIKEAAEMLQRLDYWDESYESEVRMVGKYTIGAMPPEYRRNSYLDEPVHIAESLRESFDLDREDWICLSVSFYYNLKEPEKGLRKYFSFPGDTRLKIKNATTAGIEEKADCCLITEVHISDDADRMLAPLIAYAAENNIELVGEFYGREETNYYSDGKRLGLYKVYAPIQKNKLQNILTSGLPRGLKFFCQKKQKRRLNDGQTAKPNRRILWRESS